jgi:chromosome segregation ATPase
MSYTLTEAAQATGKVRSTIFKACKSGKISYTTDDHDEIRIDPAELHRVYPPVSKNVEGNVENETAETIGNGNGNSLLRQEVEFLREKLADLDRVKEEQRRELSGRIEDLRQDRDDLRNERDRLLKVIEEQAGSFRVLTDQRLQQEPAAKQEPQRRRLGLYGRLFGTRG